MKKLNIKLFASLLICIILISTAAFCIIKPKMHKPVQFSIIDYIIKFRDDGAVSTTIKQTTMQFATDKN